MKIKMFKFCFYFYLNYALTVVLYDFDLSVLKITLRKYFWWTFTGQGIPVDFKTEWLLISHSQGIHLFLFFKFKCSCILLLKHSQYISHCKLNFTCGYQYSLISIKTTKDSLKLGSNYSRLSLPKKQKMSSW